jgi:predicted MFS family arabinose efflux permease
MRVPVKSLMPAFAATMMGIGLARFSFTPIAAMMVEQQYLTSNDITVVAAFMMAAYILGAFSAHRMAAEVGLEKILRWCFLLVPAGLLIEGFSTGFWPDVVTRVLMNYSGAVLMVLGPGAILSGLNFRSRAFAGGVVFTGVGFGVLVAGSVVAFSAAFPIVISSVMLFVIAAGVAIVGWNGWPRVLSQNLPVDRDQPVGGSRIFSISFIALLLAYGADAIAFVPHTVYLSDFVSSELSYGVEIGGAFWAIFGIGAVIGAMSVAALTRWFGIHGSIELVLLVKGLAIISVGFNSSPLVVGLSAFIVGALTPGIVMLVALRVAGLVSPDDYTKAWGIMTGCFAIGQFIGATGMSAAFHDIEKYRPLFMFGGVVELIGLAILIVGFRVLTPVKQRI